MSAKPPFRAIYLYWSEGCRREVKGITTKVIFKDAIDVGGGW